MKRVTLLVSLLTAAALLCAMPAAAAYDSVKTYQLTTRDGYQYIAASPDTAAFWESPRLEAGCTRYDGTLVLENKSDKIMDFALQEIRLPYGDRSALTYLDALRITVRSEEETLYDGPYSRIADPDGGLRVQYSSVPVDGSVSLSVTLSCPFDFDGKSGMGDEPVRWTFTASASAPIESPAQPARPIAATVLVCVAAVLAIACAAIGAVGLTKRRKRH